MKKALFVVPSTLETKNMEESLAKEFCNKKGFQYIGKAEISIFDLIENPKNILNSITKYDPDIVISDASIVAFSEFLKKQEKSLLSLVEAQGIAWIDYYQDQSIRETIYEQKEEIEKILEETQNPIPVVVLYKGNKDFQEDEEFQLIVEFIRKELKSDSFSVMLYRKDSPNMVSDVLEFLKYHAPNYIIQKEPFESEKLREVMKAIESWKDKLEVEIINMEDIEKSMKMEKHEVNINLFMH